MSTAPVTVRPVDTKKDKKAFIDFAWEVYKDDPHWVPPLKDEVNGLITPGKNPWFEHARAQLWLAERGGKTVGRISAQVDDLVQQHMGKGFGEDPTAMMGHHRPEYQAWIESAGYSKAKDLLTYEVDIAHWNDPKIDRL